MTQQGRTVGYSDAFYAMLLGSIGAPVTATNIRVMRAWKQAEGPQGDYNPFNTTQYAPGSTTYAASIRSYKDAASAVKAYQKQLLSLYPGIVKALRKGNAGDEAIQAIVNSPWAEGHYYGAGNYKASSIYKIYASSKTPNISPELAENAPIKPDAPDANALPTDPAAGLAQTSVTGSVGTIRDWFFKADFWKQAGYGTLGLSLVIVGIAFVFHREIASAAQTAGKVAVKAV